MKESPFLTIGIASYNYSSYLKKAFEQIKKQTFTDYEILYCDDGSTDDSVEVIRRLMQQNPSMQIRLVEGKNGGILANKNRILDNARGEYLMICDADDYMADGCLQALCTTAQTTNADCIIGGFEEVDGKGDRLKIHTPPPHASKWLYTWHHAQIYKLKLVQDNKIRFRQNPDDVCYLQQVHLHSKKVEFVREALYVWVRHEDSTSAQANGEWNAEKLWTSLSDFMEKLRSQVDGDDKNELNYYLYKWYYFNICDLPKMSSKNLSESIAAMQGQMEKVVPHHKKIKTLVAALHTGDTIFARCAVAGCWLTEKIGLTALPNHMRGLQSRMRGKSLAKI